LQKEDSKESEKRQTEKKTIEDLQEILKERVAGLDEKEPYLRDVIEQSGDSA
jgi:hypothetical protein